jgi:hypothetical protein
MADLKPIGSEKLTGMDKINRILEISRYNENKPSNVNETSRNEYGITLTDGNSYQIVKERLGYIIKKTISESETDYIEPMKNRKYYPSYSQALKRLNLVTKEVNRLTENEEGTSLFGEQKKFVLKTQKSQEPESDMPPPPAEPPAVPTPELPPSPEGEQPMNDMGDEGEEPMDDMGGMSPEGEEPMDDMGDEETPKDEEVSFKSIQKLTGKLTQKMREFDNEKGLTSENIKYVINMVLSAADLNSLSEEDKEDIISKFDEEEGMDDMGDEGMGDMDMNDMGMEPEGEETVNPETTESEFGSILDSIFSESKVEKTISKYFEVTKKEINSNKINESVRGKRNSMIVENKMKNVVSLCETIEQELSSNKFLKNNPNFVFVGKTNLNNLVFETKDEQIKITPSGNII